MTLGLLTLAYLAIGIVLALVTARRTRSFSDAGLVLLAWPLYAPAMRTPTPSLDPPARMAEAVREALATVREAADGSPFASLLGPAAERRLLDEIDRAAARMRAIDAELAGARTRAAAITTTTAALRADSQASLRALQTSDRAAMVELVELLGALRTRIVLARHAGSSAEGPTALVGELWARIDGLGEAVALTDPSSGARPDAAA